jgi:hypothetical protein
MKNTKHNLIINRINQPEFVISKGLTVKVWLNKDKSFVGIVQGISIVRQEVKVNNVWCEAARVYPTDPMVITSKFTKRYKLTAILKSVNQEPPGGWEEEDKV